MNVRPDPTFHATPRLAMQAPPETLAFTLMLSPDGSQPDGLAVVNVDPKSKDYGKIVHQVIMPNKGDEFHHFGWNACSSSLSPLTGHAFLERRYLIIPGIRSSRIYVIDVKEPLKAKIHKIIEPEEVFAKTGYSRPHTIHCGPEGIYVSTLGGGGADGTDGPPGIFIMDCETFEILGRYEMDRGKQDKHYDFWWNLPRDYMVSFGMGPAAAVRERARAGGPAVQQVRSQHPLLEPARTAQRPDHRPGRQSPDGAGNPPGARSGEGLRLLRRGGRHHQPAGRDLHLVAQATASSTPRRPITIDPQPAKADDLPPLLKGFEAVPPLVTDIDLSLDDKYLYVACWGTGEMHQYDVSDPMNPKLAGKVEIGGIVKQTKHPNGKTFGYGPQMVEISRDGKRVYWTNSLYSTWDDQFYPGDRGAAMVMADVGANGGITLDKDFWVEFPKGYRSHQIRLEGGDCSTDSFCYPNV